MHGPANGTPLDPEDLFSWLIAFFNARYQGQPNKSLIDVYKVHKDFMEWDSGQIDALFQHRIQVLDWLGIQANRDCLANYLAGMTLDFFYQSRRLLPFSEKNLRSVQHLYRQALQETGDLLKTAEARYWQSAYRMLLKCHLIRLHAVLASLVAPGVVGEFNYAWIYRDALTSEYGPEWQLRMLGLKPEAVTGEVLDLGCGKHANLARFFQAPKHSVTGIDRLADAGAGVTCADWFELKFKPERWDLILSHLAFSNHVWFHYFSPQGIFDQYAAKFFELLQALKPNGRLAYFPALPFLERQLPSEKFQCRHVAIDPLPELPPECRVPGLIATHIERLA
jgi:SAM-dependent methyltransferase